MYRLPQVLAFLLVSCCALKSHAGVLRTIALSGDPAPGTDATYARLSIPQLNSSGQVSFLAWLAGEGVTDGNAAGIWSEGGGTLHLVTRAGDLHTIPGAPNPGRLVRFEDHWFNDAGVVLLRGSPSASVLTNQYSYWTSAEPGINYVVRSPALPQVWARE